MRDFSLAVDKIGKEYEKADKAFAELSTDIKHLEPAELFCTADRFKSDILKHSLVEFGSHFLMKEGKLFDFNMLPQPSFNKNFDLLLKDLDENTKAGISNLILSDNLKQTERIQTILSDLKGNRGLTDKDLEYSVINLSLHEGFIDREGKLACYTDHQIFERYHKYRIRDGFAGKQAITMKETLRPATRRLCHTY